MPSKQQKRKRNRHQEESQVSSTATERGWLRRHRWGLLVAFLCCACACVVWALARPAAVQFVRAYPHDEKAYTQGLVFENGFLYEGTGKRGQSTLRKVELETGRVVQSHSLDRGHFGEGIAIVGDRIVQLTWQAQIGIVYDKETFEEVGRFRYTGEGWGITYDGTHLIISDGSATLRFLDPETFKVTGQVLVRNRGRRVPNLNELEYVRGEILANVWYKDYIVRISPRTGQVVGTIDLRRLYPANRRDREAVMNGIAYDAEKNRLFVTGKNWPRLFEVRFAPR
ncbi:MAG: glutaminyl-peptide cyclotransferase [Planctomycetes bacterium]|nr:glutaminyl-peptide cyclotransferase [Planctomycetota bacterium]MBL7042318.1 glutaminyl-peptide cyclotransferase [Pirellulaceae bacterium]